MTPDKADMKLLTSYFPLCVNNNLHLKGHIAAKGFCSSFVGFHNYSVADTILYCLEV